MNTYFVIIKTKRGEASYTSLITQNKQIMENEFIYIDGERIKKSVAKESENLLKQLKVALWILEEKGITTGQSQMKSAIKKAIA